MSKTVLILIPTLLLVHGCGTKEQDPAMQVLEIAGAENTYRLAPNLITGGMPQDEMSFAELKKLGVTTVVSVAEAPPNVEAAEKNGLKYIHIPLTYDGVSVEQRDQILRAAADSDGAVYMHCQSGRNRAATAAAMCLVGNEGRSVDEAIQWMKTRGTAEEHVNLWKAVRETAAKEDAP